MDAEPYLNDALLWSLVEKFTKKESTLNKREDLMNEARAAAYFATSRYDKRKSASLESFVYECVKNRLTDLARKEKKSPKFEFSGLDVGVDFCDESDDLNFSISMRQLLKPLEYQVFHNYFVEDRSEREIAKILGLTRAGVKKCLHLITQRYLLIEKSHHKTLTTRAHTSRWLEDSPD